MCRDLCMSIVNVYVVGLRNQNILDYCMGTENSKTDRKDL